MSAAHSKPPAALIALLALGGCGGGGADVANSPTAVATPGGSPAPGVPRLLSATGLFADTASYQVAPDVQPYTPQYALWADGAGKSRWYRLPLGAQIDTSDMDHWSFPVGTRFWKEFRVGGRLIETRMISRFGTGPEDFTYATYQWRAAGDDADYVADGVLDAAGTGHDIPPSSLCVDCHGKLREHILGFGAVQLSHSLPGVSITTLSQGGALTVPAPAGFAVPGDAATTTALGYLHANCGHCHNPDGVVFTVPYVLRLQVAATRVEDTGVYQTAIGVPAERFQAAGITYRIAPGDPAASAIVYRMSARGSADQMPPLATNLADPAGLGALRAWISELPH